MGRARKLSALASRAYVGDERHDRGYFGEQEMGFFLGERGYFIVVGPSGSGGHGITEKGLDGVAYNPKRDHLIIYDNKAFARSGNVASATAIDPAKRLASNLDPVIRQVEGLSDMPKQARVLDLLRQTRAAVQAGTRWPVQVQVAVANAGGKSTGVSGRLAGSGIQFIDFYQAPPASMSARVRMAISNQAIAAAAGSLLAQGLARLGRWGIDREVKRRLENEKQLGIQRALVRGLGVLVIIELQESDASDFNGVRSLSLLDVFIQSGATREEAIKAWESQPHLLKGPVPGTHVVKEYGWIPPIATD